MAKNEASFHPPNNPTTPKQPTIPLNAIPTNVPTAPTQLRHMLGLTLQFQEPAKGTASALATTEIGQASFKNNLGTPRPSEVLVGLDATNTYLFVLPVRPKTPGATPVKYEGGRCFFNLYHTFAKLDRLVQPGVREYYTVRPTPGEVTIGDVKGWGVYIDLTEVTKEAISRLSEEERTKRSEKRRQTIAAKKAAQQAAREAAGESAPGAEEPEE